MFYHLFCLASNHTIETSYEWICEGVKVGISSPVLYVCKPGLYQCLVTDTDDESISTRKFDVIPAIKMRKGIDCVLTSFY